MHSDLFKKSTEALKSHFSETFLKAHYFRIAQYKNGFKINFLSTYKV